MDTELRATALKQRFSKTARNSFAWLRTELLTIARRTYGSHTTEDGALELLIEEYLKRWITKGGISLQSCTDLKSILARLNRLAGEDIAETVRGEWRLERFPPTSHLFQVGQELNTDHQYALICGLHKVLNLWEESFPGKAIAIEMYFWGGFGYQEIGDSLKVNPKTAWEWVQEGLEFLKRS